MKYTKNAYERAAAEINSRRESSEKNRTQRLNEIKTTAPEIYKLYNNTLSTQFSMLAEIIGNGGTNGAASTINDIKNKNLMAQQTIKELLDTFGYPTDYLQYHYYCEKCRDTGFVEGRRCECFEKLLSKFTTEELNQQCSIQLHDFSEFRIDFYPQQIGKLNPRDIMSAVYSDCLNYANNFTPNADSLFFFGKTGLGKTFLSSCIAKKLLNEGVNVFFGSILKLFRQIEDERFRRRDGDTTGIIINAELVILDDLGSEFQTLFTDSVLYEIINERLNSGRPTIISTNLSMKELDSKYNDRIVSRLMGFFSPIMFIGNDVRQEKRKMGIS